MILIRQNVEVSTEDSAEIKRLMNDGYTEVEVAPEKPKRKTAKKAEE